MKRAHVRLPILFACMAISLIWSASPASADLTNWTAGGGGTFGNPANWDNGVPDANDAAAFNLGAASSYQVILDSLATAGETQVRTGTVEFALSGHTFNTSGNLFVAFDANDSAWMKANGGTLESSWADVGHMSGNSGRLTLSGSDTVWTNANDVTIGRGAEGTVEILSGATVTFGRDAYIGNTVSGEDTPAAGTLSISGFDSSLTLARMFVGIGAGDAAEAVGVATISGDNSMTLTGQLAVGSGAVGKVTISGGALITSNKGASASLSSGLIGVSNGGRLGEGQVTVSGADSHWAQDGSLGVGFTANGTLRIEDDGTVDSQMGHVARRSGSSGLAVVTGTDSSWSVGDELYIGGEAPASRGGLGAGGAGELDVRSGGMLDVASRLELWDAGTLDVTGGGWAHVGGSSATRFDDMIALTLDGEIAGSGTIKGTLVNYGGTVSPGHSFGTLTMDAFTQEDGELNIDLGGLTAGEHDVLDIGGAMTAGGVLNLIFVDGFLPKTGNVFELFHYASLSGGFDDVNVLNLDPGWDYTLDTTTPGVLKLVSNNDAVPEPAAATLIALGFLAALLRRRNAAGPRG